MTEPTEPYASIDQLLEVMRPKMQRLLLREMLAEAVQRPVTLQWAMDYHKRLCAMRNRGEL